MTQQNSLRAVFWAVLVLFLAWDHLHSPPVDLRFEAPLIAAGFDVETCLLYTSPSPRD